MSSKLNSHLGLGAFLLSTVIGSGALAQETNTEQVRDDQEDTAFIEDTSELSEKSKEDLRDEGFVFGDDANLSTSSTATLVALIAGLPIHGIGHFWIDDSRTGNTLLIAEGISIVTMAAAGTYIWLDSSSSSASGWMSSVFELGLSSFAIGYLLDVIGTIQGVDREFTLNTRNSQRYTAEAGYGFLSTEEIPTRHLLNFGLGADFGAFYTKLDATSDIEVASLSGSLLLGTRFLRLRPQSFIFVEAKGEVFGFREAGPFWRSTVEGRLGGSLDMGTFFTQLNQVAVGFWVGYGQDFLRFEEDFAVDFEGGSAFLTQQAFIHFNATENLNIFFGHGRHPSWYIPAVNRFVGTTDVEIRYRTNFGRLKVGATIGSGLGLSIGGQMGF